MESIFFLRIFQKFKKWRLEYTDNKIEKRLERHVMLRMQLGALTLTLTLTEGMPS